MTQNPDSVIYKYTTVLNAVHPDVLFDSQGIEIIHSNTSIYC
jgi:hypothetical protein